MAKTIKFIACNNHSAHDLASLHDALGNTSCVANNLDGEHLTTPNQSVRPGGLLENSRHRKLGSLYYRPLSEL